MATEKRQRIVTKPEKVVEANVSGKLHRQHQWKHNQHPNDPDADPESGWSYVELKPLDTDTTIKTTRDMLTGGVDSGLPCVCGTMTMWVQTVSALKIMEEANMDVRAEHQRKALREAEVAIIVCPKCERITQSPATVARAMRDQYLRRDEP